MPAATASALAPHCAPLYPTFPHCQCTALPWRSTGRVKWPAQAGGAGVGRQRRVAAPGQVNPDRESHVNRPGRTVSTQSLSVRPVTLVTERTPGQAGDGGDEGSRGEEDEWSPIPGATPAARSMTWCGPPTGSLPRSSRVIEGKAESRPPRAHGPARRGPPADRGRARCRQDDAGQGAGPVDRLLGAPHPVHPGPAPQRHHRGQRLQPGTA